MCGIAGFYGKNLPDDSIQSILGSLAHRGPDSNGFFISENIGLLHTRLSILDLSPLGNQPYYFFNLVLVFNGEVYNYKELRHELTLNGYSFNSESDAEVVIKAYHCWGDACLDRFIGMFSLVIYDKATHTIFAARDRLGVKPFYYYFFNGQFYFASELKIFSKFNLMLNVDLQAVYYYFRFGYVPEPLSIYQGIRKLQPGHTLNVSSSGMVDNCYWKQPAPSGDLIVRSEESWIDEFEHLAQLAFEYRMVSDVPVGLFLSGGMDSSLLAAILSKRFKSVKSFTIGFNDQRFDESKYASQIANELGLEHYSETLDVSGAKELLGAFYKIYDEPFADTSGIPVAAVVQLAKNSGVKVVLSADGGDELLGGYNHYLRSQQIASRLAYIPLALRNSCISLNNQIIALLRATGISVFNAEHRVSAVNEILSFGNIDLFESIIANQTNQEISKLVRGIEPALLETEFFDFSLSNMMRWDLSHYLPGDLMVKVDRASMYYGVEVRDPFLDHKLVEFSMRLPDRLKIRNGQTKYIERKLLERYFPIGFFDRKKQGFSIPLFSWFNKEFDTMFREYFTNEYLDMIPFLDKNEVYLEYKKYLYFKSKGKEYNIEKMWRMLSFVLWWVEYGKK